MSTFVTILIALCVIGLLFCFASLVEDSRASRFISDFSNQRKIRKCFGQEGLQIYFEPCTHTCHVTFHHKGSHCDRRITFAKAVALYRAVPTGHGLRKLFIKKDK